MIKKFIFFVFSAVQAFAQYAYLNPTSGAFCGEVVYGDKVIQVLPDKGECRKLILPEFKKIGDQEFFSKWDGTNLYKFYNHSPGRSSVIMLELGHIQKRLTEPSWWVWSSPVSLPAGSSPVAAFDQKLLFVFRTRETKGSKITRRLTIAQVELPEGVITPLETMELKNDVYINHVGIQRGEFGYLLLDNGNLFKWDPSRNTLDLDVSNIFSILESKRFKPSQGVPSFYYNPIIEKDPFVDANGSVYFCVTLPMKTDKAHLAEHYNASSKEVQMAMDKLGFQKEKEGEIKIGHPITYFLKFDPDKNVVSEVNQEQTKHLYESGSGPLCTLSPKVGDFLFLDDKEKVQVLNPRLDLPLQAREVPLRTSNPVSPEK